MREIIFKAKRTDNGEREFGYYCHVGPTGCEKHYIIPVYASAFYGVEVDPATVCQYTGLTDENGVKIFEGDCLCEFGEDENGKEGFYSLGVVTYWESEGRYVLTDENGICNDWTLEDEAQPENWKRLTVLGNVKEVPHEH